MTDSEMILFELPASIDADDLLVGLTGSVMVPRLRSAEIGTAITIAVDLLSGTASVVTLLIARHELADFGNRLIRYQRRRPASDDDDKSLELTAGDDKACINVEDDDANQQFVQAVGKLLEAETSVSRNPDNSGTAVSSPENKREDFGEASAES